MSPPDYFGVEYVINSWMEGNIGATCVKTALQQWEALYALLSARDEVHLLPAVPGLPDLCFTANAGLVFGNTFIPSRFRFLERQREEPLFLKWFSEHGFQISSLKPATIFEGEGDALFQPGETFLWLGYNLRTSIDASKPLQHIINKEIVALHLVNPHFYHLDTCFTPLPNGRIIYYPAAFDAISLEKIHTKIPAHNRYAVIEEDAMNFACNAIVSDNWFICNHASPTLRTQLQAWNFEVLTTPLTQFMLAGGAAKCLVLSLSHQWNRWNRLLTKFRQGYHLGEEKFNRDQAHE